MPKKYHGYTLTKDRKGGGFSTVEDPKIKGTTIQEVKRAIDLKIGSPSSDPTTFLINAWKFFKNNIDRNAPDEIREAFNGSSLRVPEGDDDTMLAPFKMMAHVCPPSLLSPDIFAQKDDVAIVLRERGEPMTTDDIITEMQSRGYQFYGLYHPRGNLHRALRKQAEIDGSMIYRDRKWSMVKDKIIPPL